MICSEYLQVFLQSYFGQLQIQRHESGVSGQTHINKQEIEAMHIPILDVDIQNKIRDEYERVSLAHDEAMHVVQKSKEKALIKLKEANSILNDLISRTESIIRGKTDDI